MTKRLFMVLLAAAVAVSAAVGFWLFSRPSTEEQIAAAIEQTWNEAVGDDEPAYLQEIGKRSSYEIISMEGENEYIIHTVVTGIDMSGELDSMSMEELPQDEAEINALLIEMIGRCPQVETEAVIYAQHTEDGYQIAFSDTFVDAMSGKLYSYYTKKINEMAGGVEG